MLNRWSKLTTLQILVLTHIIVANWLKNEIGKDSSLLDNGNPCRNEIGSCPGIFKSKIFNKKVGEVKLQSNKIF